MRWPLRLARTSSVTSSPIPPLLRKSSLSKFRTTPLVDDPQAAA